MVVSIPTVEVGPKVFCVVGRATPTGPVLLRADRDLDLTTVPAARAELAALLAEPAPCLLLHLGTPRFVDMRGMRLLVETARRAGRRGGELTVVAAPRCLRTMVARLGLDDELPLVGDRIGAGR